MSTPDTATLDADVQVSFRDILDDVKTTVAADYMQARIDLAVERATARALREQLAAARVELEQERANGAQAVGMLVERDALIGDLRAQVDVLIERVRAQEPDVEDAQQVDGARAPESAPTSAAA